MKKNITLIIAVIVIVVLTVILTRACTSQPTAIAPAITTDSTLPNVNYRDDSGIYVGDVALGAIAGAALTSAVNSNRKQTNTTTTKYIQPIKPKNKQTQKPVVKSTTTKSKPVNKPTVKKVNLTKKSKPSKPRKRK